RCARLAPRLARAGKRPGPRSKPATARLGREPGAALSRRWQLAGGGAGFSQRGGRARRLAIAADRLRTGGTDRLPRALWGTTARGIHHPHPPRPYCRHGAPVLPALLRSRIARPLPPDYGRATGAAAAAEAGRLSRRAGRRWGELLGCVPAAAVQPRLLARRPALRRVSGAPSPAEQCLRPGVARQLRLHRRHPADTRAAVAVCRRADR